MYAIGIKRNGNWRYVRYQGVLIQYSHFLEIIFCSLHCQANQYRDSCL